MRMSIAVVTVLAGSVFLAPLMLGPAQAASKHCNRPRFDNWYGYYYCPGTRCFHNGYWRACRA
jgi:hypothetical protein